MVLGVWLPRSSPRTPPVRDDRGTRARCPIDRLACRTPSLATAVRFDGFDWGGSTTPRKYQGKSEFHGEWGGAAVEPSFGSALSAAGLSPHLDRGSCHKPLSIVCPLSGDRAVALHTIPVQFGASKEHQGDGCRHPDADPDDPFVQEHPVLHPCQRDDRGQQGCRRAPVCARRRGMDAVMEAYRWNSPKAPNSVSVLPGRRKTATSARQAVKRGQPHNAARARPEAPSRSAPSRAACPWCR